jgi:energy-coupling factor transporter transmembrane protein EcfT
MFISLLVLPIEKPSGVALIFLTIIISYVLIRPDVNYLRKIFIFAFIMLFPVFLLIPFMPVKSYEFFDLSRFYSREGIIISTSLFLKGLLSVLLFSMMSASLKISELISGLNDMRLPRIVILLISQIIQQTGMMYQEINKVAQAISLRRRSSDLITTLLIIRYMPIVLMGRLSKRAVSISYAMQLRGYEDINISSDFKDRYNFIDILVITFATLWLILTINIRIGKFL